MSREATNLQAMIKKYGATNRDKHSAPEIASSTSSYSHSDRDILNQHAKEVESDLLHNADRSNNLNWLKRQRNALAVFCMILFTVSITLGITLIANRQPTVSLPGRAAITTEAAPVAKNYVASVNSEKYHWPTCRHAQNIDEKNMVYYATAADAEADNKSPCSVCQPK